MLGILQDNLLPLPDNYKMEKSKGWGSGYNLDQRLKGHIKQI